MKDFFDQMICGSNNNYSFVTFEFFKRKYSNCFRLDSIGRDIDEKGQEIDLYTFVSGEHVVIVALSDFKNMIGFSENGVDYRVYRMIMMKGYETENPFLNIVVLDTHAKTYRRDLKKIRAMPNKQLLIEDALNKFESIDIVCSEFI